MVRYALSLVVGLAALFASCGLSASNAEAADWPTLLLDVGAPGDDDHEAVAHLDIYAGLSEPIAEAGRTYRTLDENRTLTFRFSTESLAIAENGVPYRDAVIDISYRDDVDETNCYRFSSSRSYCRPRIDVLLDYGENPPLEWHGLRAFAGLADGEWKTESVFVEANPWQTLRSIEGFFELRIVYPNQEDNWSPLAIDSITLRFPDEATFHLQREGDRVARGLERAEYVAPNELDPSEYGSEYVVFARNYLEKVYPTTVPYPEEITDRVSAFEVPGEREPVTFGIYAFEDVQDVSVEVGDLTARGANIDSSRIEVSRVRFLDKRWMYGYDKYYGLNPWYLDHGERFDVPAGQSRLLWLTIDVPVDASPDVYEGTIAVSAANAPRTELTLSLTVVGVALDEPDALPFVYHSPYMSYKHFAPTTSTAVRDMAAHDVYPIIYLDASIDLEVFDIDLKDLEVELAEFDSLGILPREPRLGISDNAGSLWRKLCPDLDYYTGRCPVFDRVYKTVLQQYAQAFAVYGATPVLSFTDEPGTDPDKRMRSNYLHRLTKEAGLDTWVTYYPRCEEPLAGHHIEFDDRSGSVSRRVPEWLSDDPYVRAHWDFEDGTLDKSPNRNDGELVGSAVVENGELVLPDTASYMKVPHNYTLSLEEEATIYLWLRPTACHSSYARHPVAKWSSTDDANYVLYFFGDYDGKYPEYKGRLTWYANIDGTWTSASGTTAIDCDEGVDRWYNVVWTYDAHSGGVMYVNGMGYEASRTGPLTTNSASLLLGRFIGAMDDIVMLDRALTEQEQLDLARALNEGYDKERELALTLVVDSEELAPTLTFSIHDGVMARPELETGKAASVNGHEAWAQEALEYQDQAVAIDLSPYLVQPGPNSLRFAVENRESRHEDLTLYFIEDIWRLADWSVVVESTDEWTYSHEIDVSGSLGPMAPYLDERVHAMRYVTAEAADLTRADGDDFSFYTTYPANQPVILNNRFLNGIYASAVGAEGVWVYAYGDWGPQPWDDTEPGTRGRAGTAAGQRGQGGYQLVLPSWEDRVYDTVVFESLREGVEDSRVIATLKRAIAEHPGALAAEASAYLDDLLSRPTPDYWPRYMHSDGTLPIHEYADRSGEMLTDLAGDAAEFGALDEMRRRMLHYIQKLQAAGNLYLPYTSS